MEIRFKSNALRQLSSLDAKSLRQIIRRLSRLLANFDDIQHERLTGTLSDLYKHRIGDYRVLYQIIENDTAILIHRVGHRRDVYDF